MNSTQTPNSDSAQLHALGYAGSFDRRINYWENFALGFTYLSPVVGVYTLFSAIFPFAGPPLVWVYAMAGVGQMMVCLIFGEVVSQFPIAGGIYPWARRLVGRRWSWMAGWIYGWALFTSVAAVATGAGPLLALLIGIPVTSATNSWLALGMIGLATALNLLGTKWLARIAFFGFVCELIGAIVVGGYLLIAHRHSPIGAILHSQGYAKSAGSYLSAFLTASLAGLFCCYGFEACGDVAEETPNPGIVIPKSMRMTIYIGISAAFFLCFALVLAVPDVKAAIDGTDKDPLATILTSAFGPVASKAVIVIVMVSFVSCVLSLQAAGSRLLFSFARDRNVAASDFLQRLSPRTHVPVGALLVSGVVPAIVSLLTMLLSNQAIQTIISFAVIGIYVAFQMVVLGAFYARARGWKPAGPFTLGTFGWVVNSMALLWGVFAVGIILRPITPDAPWYQNYAMTLTTSVVVGAGLVYMLLFRLHTVSEAPSGDAYQL